MFQLPALMAFKERDMAAVVVSPLISLMHDQVLLPLEFKPI